MSESTFSLRLLATRMKWLEKRTSLIAGNVANVATPDYRPYDLDEGRFVTHVESSLARQRLGASRRAPALPAELENDFAFSVRREPEPASLETEMMRMTETQIAYKTMTTLYRHHLNLLKKAVGR